MKSIIQKTAFAILMLGMPFQALAQSEYKEGVFLTFKTIA